MSSLQRKFLLQTSTAATQAHIYGFLIFAAQQAMAPGGLPNTAMAPYAPSKGQDGTGQASQQATVSSSCEGNVDETRIHVYVCVCVCHVPGEIHADLRAHFTFSHKLQYVHTFMSTIHIHSCI